MPRPRVVVFARLPTPGRAKTRLIPALGARGAAEVHRRLTERTLARVRLSGLPFEVRSTGAPPAAFTAWLGDAAVIDQGEGDLGRRLLSAGPPYPTLFIGSDAPDLTPTLLLDAAAALDRAEALLGLRRRCDAVFADMTWSTDRVCAETRARLHAASMPPALLPVLADCDRPEDLARWPELLG